MLPAAALIQNMGRVNEGVALRDYPIASDPLSPCAQFNLGIAYLNAGRPDDAITACRRSPAISPRRTVAHYIIGLALLAKHEPAAAIHSGTISSYRQAGVFGSSARMRTSCLFRRSSKFA